MAESAVPTHYQLFNPTLQALRQLGGSGSIHEIHDVVASLLELSDEQMKETHDSGKGTKSKLWHRLGWARTYLRKYGLLENSSRGVWALTPQGLATEEVDSQEVNQVVLEMIRKENDAVRQELSDSVVAGNEQRALDEAIYRDEQWRASLFDVLTQMHPSAFERLFQRVLRESGFTQVEVTGRSGDGGIDGIGVVRIGGFLSFRVLFQCKRFKSAVGAGAVRDFRGAMIGRTDKGLIVTTGNFTPAALREATRDGAPEIDLIDGEQLMDKLKELSLGVQTEQVMTERVTVNPDFFAGI